MFKSALLTRALAAMVSLAGVTGLAVAPIFAQTNAKPQPELRKILSTPSPAELIQAPMAAKLADRLGQVWFEFGGTSLPGEPVARSGFLSEARADDARGRRRPHEAACCGLPRTDPRPDAEFAAQAGKGAIAELRRLSAEPVVKEFLVQMRSRSAVEQTQTYLENIERALLLNRVEIKGHANPLASGDTDLQEEIEKATSAPLDYADANKGKSMDRFLELLIIAERTLAETSNRDELLLMGAGKADGGP